MPKKPETEKVDPRVVTRGIVVWSRDGKSEQVIRNVAVVVQFANGYDETYVVGQDEIEILAEQPKQLPKSALLKEPSIVDTQEAT